MIQLPTPCIFAHRGASGEAPENTLASFDLALQQGAHAIELDAKLSADGEIVVIHDPTLERTTDGEGWVHQTNLSELRSLDAGGWFSPSFVNERIPLLREVLESTAANLLVNIEVTNYRSWWDDLPEKLVELVTRMNLQHRVLFSSFYPWNLWKIKKLLPEAAVALLSEPKLYPLIRFSGLGKITSAEMIHPYYQDLDQNLIDAAHARGTRLHAWTVNEAADMQKFLSWGIDGLFTDFPARALKLLQSESSRMDHV